MQGRVCRFEETADAACGLADALLVLDQREAHVVVTVLAKADARRDRDVEIGRASCRERVYSNV